MVGISRHEARAREDTPATQAACREAIEALNRHRATLEADDMCNIGYMACREQHGARWGRGSIRTLTIRAWPASCMPRYL